MQTLATLLKAARGEVGLTSDQLADSIHVSRTYISNLENGKKLNPSMEVIADLSKVLGKPVNYFFGSSEVIGFIHSLPRDIQERILSTVLEPHGTSLDGDESAILEAFIAYFRSPK
ncbi:helix-turn-helix transcriptional regulator [Tumebacillus permanentifrigoris]|uniref:DNA-binding XRE family transcriptional regulator n=1 Tax=Tumebacillus permanentifrigoris TaxID=378543 RepID=A0A316D2P7_9BACL|nr:helix-turn-helix transcriptional regulator [Tumebacillus permanentifrigoris]PWK05154.1 DNA-binding XRE family transcriptional regulator [Tumebacillus permanentifrigoris]